MMLVLVMLERVQLESLMTWQCYTTVHETDWWSTEDTDQLWSLCSQQQDYIDFPPLVQWFRESNQNIEMMMMIWGKTFYASHTHDTCHEAAGNNILQMFKVNEWMYIFEYDLRLFQQRLFLLPTAQCSEVIKSECCTWRWDLPHLTLGRGGLVPSRYLPVFHHRYLLAVTVTFSRPSDQQ